MSDAISIYDESGQFVGSARCHETPRIGEALQHAGRAWRVLDVGHPSEPRAGTPIHVPRIRARPEDVPWFAATLNEIA